MILHISKKFSSLFLRPNPKETEVGYSAGTIKHYNVKETI
jgi:hypothetical protein